MVPIQILQPIGHRSCQITMTRMAIMRRQVRPLRRLEPLESFPSFFKNFEKNSTMLALVLRQNEEAISLMERRVMVSPLPFEIQRFGMH